MASKRERECSCGSKQSIKDYYFNSDGCPFTLCNKSCPHKHSLCKGCAEIYIIDCYQCATKINVKNYKMSR